MSSLQFLSLFLVGLRFAPVLAQTQNVNFNQVVSLNGDMNLNTVIFPDGTKIEAFSQTQRQLIVNQNPQPVTANHVIGSSGQPFVQLSQNSISIATNGATDLVGAQIEMPIQQQMLDQNGVTADNTFVAKLAPDRQAWMVMEGIKTVNTTDNTVRMIKLNAIDGEYMAIGRKTVETSNVLTPFGRNAQQSVNITGSGIQEVEFSDGFRMSVRAVQPMTVNVDVVNGVSTSMLNNAQTVNNYRYLVRTNLASVMPNLNQMMAVVQLPLNPSRVMQMAQRMGAGPNDAVMLGISQRPVLQNPGGASGSLAPPQKRQDTNSSSAAAADAQSTAASSPSSAAAAADAQPTAASSSAAADAAAASATASSASAASSAAASSPSSAAAPAASDPAQGGSSTTNSNNPAATNLLLAPSFTPVAGQPVLDQVNARIAVTVQQLDGEFLITMGMAGTAGQTSVQPGALGQTAPSGGQNASAPRPARRQTPPQAPAPQGIMMTMAELDRMVQQQKNGGYLPIGAMMKEFQAKFGTPDPVNPLIPPPLPERSAEELKKETVEPVRRRAVPLIV